MTTWSDVQRALGGGEPIVPAGVERALVPDGIAAVVTTSGSTGPGKQVALSGRALLASAHATQQVLGRATWTCALPTEYVAGVMTLVRAYVAGLPPRFAAADLRDLDPAPGVNAISLVGTQLVRALTHESVLAALRRFEVVLVGGSAVPREVLDAARAAGLAIVTTYGMTETCGGCVYDGVPLPGVVVEVVPEPGFEPGEGRIWIGGPMLFSGYLGDPDATASALQGGRLRTRDRGRWRTPGVPEGGDFVSDADGRSRASGVAVDPGADPGGVVGRGMKVGSRADPTASGSFGRSRMDVGSGPDPASTGSESLRGMEVGSRAEPASSIGVGPDRLQPGRGADRVTPPGRLPARVLEVLGRDDDVVITGGVNVDLAAVQRVVDGESVRGVVVAVPDAEWGVRIVLVAEPGRDLSDWRAALGDRLKPAALPKELVVVDTLPASDRGKLDKATLVRMVEGVTDGGVTDAFSGAPEGGRVSVMDECVVEEPSAGGVGEASPSGPDVVA